MTIQAASAPAGAVGIPDRLAGVSYRWLSAGEVELVEPLPLAGGLPDTATAVALLRDCATAALRVRWRAGPESGLDLSLLHHLPPPAGPPAPALDRWRRAYRYGSCHFRLGPGFVQVKDARDPAGLPVVLVADHPDLIATFLRCQDPTPLDALDATGRTAVDLLLEERLLLLAGGVVLTLPHRMRRWPVPYNAV
jgi:Family of unknown function (DUF5825)